MIRFTLSCQLSLLLLLAAEVAVAGPPSRPVSAHGSAIADQVDKQEPTAAERAARGYQLLTTKAYLPPDFDDTVFDELWQRWEPALREKARAATPQERRAMAFARYGLTGGPEAVTEQNTASGARPLNDTTAINHQSEIINQKSVSVQYVVDADGRWTMNCLACHQGRIAGRTIPGVPNTGFALSTLTDEVRATKLRLDKPMSRMDIGSLFMPLGTTRGTTNAVMFGVILMNYRNAQFNIHVDRERPEMMHHDLDAPAWWHYHEKRRLYYDGFVPKGHRALMQFLMVRENGPEKFHEWEADFRDIEVWIDSLRPPKYPFAIDRDLAAQGEVAFIQHCATCHGTYGAGVADTTKLAYPNKIVPLTRVGTDPLRLTALSAEHRRSYAASWFNNYGHEPVDAEPTGYIAPPLSGVWASAPYLHNGSVPTLWHMLHPAQRPAVWHRVPEGREQELEGYDQQRVGLRVESLAEVPAAATSLRERREYFDTRKEGKRATGHLFPNKLSEPERRGVLEYLKTL